MADEPEAVLLAEGLHLRDHHRIAARAPQPRQIRVVDDALSRRAAPEHQRLMEEAFHLETVEGAVELQVAPLRVAQVEQAGDDPDQLLPQFHLIDGGVVLELGARLIGHTVAPRLLALADAQLAQHPRQRGIRHRDFFFLHQLLMHTLDPAAAVRIEPPQQLRLDADLVLAGRMRHLAFLLDDCPHRVAVWSHAAGNLTQAHPLLMQQEDRLTLVRFDHEAPSSPERTPAPGSISLPSAGSPGHGIPGSRAAGQWPCPSPAACISG